MFYIHVQTLEQAKQIARRENKRNSKYNQMIVTSGKFHRKLKHENEYSFKGKY